MQKQYKYRNKKTSKNTVHLKSLKKANVKHSFYIIDMLQVILLFVIFLLWLWIRNAKTNTTEISPQPAMERLLEIAMQPIGSTMYIWGGGWNVEDKQSGAGSTRIGVSPIWEEFAQKQDATYNYEDYRYKRELGLDCSGYVGWVIYNLFEAEDGNEGYVTFSTEMAENFANRGWGKLYKNPKEFLTGDIVSMDGHVWICLGTCDDGSVLLVHSSPPGVSICGTQAPIKHLEFSNGESENTENTNTEYQNEISVKKSIAVEFAETFMEAYYPKWQMMYPNRTVSTTYLKDVTVMRWNVETLSDIKKYQEMSGEEVMQFLETLQMRN